VIADSFHGAVFGLGLVVFKASQFGDPVHSREAARAGRGAMSECDIHARLMS
jgi:hypothetical protein